MKGGAPKGRKGASEILYTAICDDISDRKHRVALA